MSAIADRRLLTAAAAALMVLPFVPSGAEAQYFGRNKVQYEAFDFKIIKTEHFDVYHYPREREAAMDAARMAERSYGRLSRLLQHEFRERKPIIVYASHSDFQQTNIIKSEIPEGTGGYAESMKRRLVLPFTGSYSEFEHVLTHELVHAFQYDLMLRGSATAEVSPMARQPPLWFMEGMAEYLAIGEVDAFTEGWLRDAVLSGYIRDIGEMSRMNDYLSYRFGQSLWAYIGSRWGDEVVGILLQRTMRTGLQRAFESTLSVSLEALSDEWLTYLRSRYLPQLTRYQGPEQVATRLTGHDRIEDASYIAPAISPNGRTMAVLTQEEGFALDLWLADARTGELQTRLVESAGDPDFHSLRYLGWSASFSPDGRYLAYGLDSDGKHLLEIYDVARREIWRRLEFDLDGVDNPSWSPDGRQVVFSGTDGGITDLFVTDLSGNLRRLTEDRHADLSPSWSPDGRSIAFSTDRGAETDFDRLVYSGLKVALYDLDAGSIEVLPSQEAGDQLNPVWAPDSRSIAWVSNRDGVANLYLFERDERRLSRLTDFLTGITSVTYGSPTLSWARDDGRLLFVYFEDAGHNVYAIDDPRALQRLPVREVDASNLFAAADGERRQESGELAAAEEIEDDAVTFSYYRESESAGDRFRPSDEAPRTGVNSGPLSVLALLDSADLALPDTADFDVENYGVKLTPDIMGRPTIGANVGGHFGNGVYGGSFIALSDILGDHNMIFAGSVSGSFSDAQILANYTYLRRRANFGVALQQVPLYRYLGRTRFPLDNGDPAFGDIYFRDVIRSAQARVSYPFSPFRRVELGVSGAYFRRDRLIRGFNLVNRRPVELETTLGQLQYFQPTAALVFDNSIFGWTGPVYGRRYRAQIGQVHGDFTYTEALLDFRNYFNFRQRVIFAGRLLGLHRTGRDANRFALFWGGPYFLRGYDGDSFALSGEECEYQPGPDLSACPVRDQLIGSSAAILNMEVRFPVITELQIGFLGNFPPVDAVAFFDGGLAWDDNVCANQAFVSDEGCGESRPVKVTWDRKSGENPLLVREPLFSTGVGLRFNIFYTVLRLDYAFPLSREDRSGVFSVSFGPSF